MIMTSVHSAGGQAPRPMARLVSAAFLSLLVAGVPASVLAHDHGRGKADDSIKGVG